MRLPQPPTAGTLHRRACGCTASHQHLPMVSIGLNTSAWLLPGIITSLMEAANSNTRASMCRAGLCRHREAQQRAHTAGTLRRSWQRLSTADGRTRLLAGMPIQGCQAPCVHAALRARASPRQRTFLFDLDLFDLGLMPEGGGDEAASGGRPPAATTASNRGVPSPEGLSWVGCIAGSTRRGPYKGLRCAVKAGGAAQGQGRSHTAAAASNAAPGRAARLLRG